MLDQELNKSERVPSAAVSAALSLCCDLLLVCDYLTQPSVLVTALTKVGGVFPTALQDTEELEAVGREGSSVKMWQSTAEISRSCLLITSGKHR